MSSAKPENIFQGLGVSPGIAIGPAYLVRIEDPQAPRLSIDGDRVEAETERFDRAVAQTRKDILNLRAKFAPLPADAAADLAPILEAQEAMLSQSRLIRAARQKITDDKINAEHALMSVAEGIRAQFQTLKDPYISARSDDVMAVARRVLRVLMNVPYLSLADVPEGGIVFAPEISPAETVFLDPRIFSGIATVHGGAAGHTAVMARSLGLPAVLGVPPAFLDAAESGKTVIVDGVEGKVILNPRADTIQKYDARLDKMLRDNRRLQKEVSLPSETKDGTAVALRGNLDTPREAVELKGAGAAGIGLFRTEYMFMGRKTLPSEEEQFESIVEAVRAMQGAPVTLRTLDIGGDKLAKAMGGYIAETPNPALGLRAIRLSLKEPHLLKTQFRAMLRAAFFGDVRILLPMVTTAEEVETARKILHGCYLDLKKEGVPVPPDLPPMGAMIEIPAAALSADSLAVVADFFALGTNDLIQYTIAIDRGNDQVASLYNPLNPSVLRLMEFTIEAGRRAGIPVSICGEMAADPQYTALLLGLGIREMSMGAASLPRVREKLRALALSDCEKLAREVMAQSDSQQIMAQVQKFNSKQ